MNRIRISANLTLGKYIVVALTVYLLYFIFFVGIDNQTMAVYCVVIVVFGIFFYLFHHSKKVEFDDDYMYITDRKKTQIIPLQNVYKIKLTMTSINNANLWKIGYYDETGQSKAIRIYLSFSAKILRVSKEQLR